MLSAPVAAWREMCGMATGASCACGTPGIVSLTPSLSYQALKSTSAFDLKARHTCGTPALTTMRERCISHRAIARFSARTLPPPPIGGAGRVRGMATQRNPQTIDKGSENHGN
jgi:hypothetical protein